MQLSSKSTTQALPPRHVAIIMDGNGRWASARGLPRIEGHRRGAKSVETALRSAKRHNIEVLTLFAFSVENWNRPADEVAALMEMLERFLIEQSKQLHQHKIRFRRIGSESGLSPAILELLHKTEGETAHYTGHTLALALNYGARTEIADAARQIARDAAAGRLDPESVDWPLVNRYLYTRDLPDPDLVIRTSGESRISNFLLLQSAYAEMYFSEVLWPDFSEAHFDAAIRTYLNRERRYGKTTEQLLTPADLGA